MTCVLLYYYTLYFLGRRLLYALRLDLVPLGTTMQWHEVWRTVCIIYLRLLLCPEPGDPWCCLPLWQPGSGGGLRSAVQCNRLCRLQEKVQKAACEGRVRANFPAGAQSARASPARCSDLGQAWQWPWGLQRMQGRERMQALDLRGAEV